jgi:glycosyltransferase involved in cell wall biosynthesis
MNTTESAVVSQGEASDRPPFISVIVPHFNDLENLASCLALLNRQTLPRDRYEIIVADNNSSCGFAAVTEVCCGFARIVSAPIQGAAEARNTGVLAAHGDVIAFIDSDCRPAPDWLEKGLQALKSADVVGGRVIVSVEYPHKPSPAEAYELVFAFNTRRYVNDKGFCVTANMFTRRTVFDRTGKFRSGVSEDLDWGQRATRLGFSVIYADDAIVHHPARRDWLALVQKWRRLTSESYNLMLEQPGGGIHWFARSWLVLLSPLVQVFYILKTEELRTASQRFGALAILIRLRVWRFVECNRLLLGEIHHGRLR